MVYKGRKKKSFEYLAVKSVEKTRRKKILNEVKIMHTLDNENILKFYSWYETRNHLWLILEYCPGGSLNSIIEADKKLPEDTVTEFACELIQALYYLHSEGVIYGDLKPHTVLFTEYGILKLGDFGLAKRVVDLVETQDNSEKKGTPFYMAPELFQEDGVLSFYSDFWSLGCVLYELATGQPPFVSASLKDLMQKILNEDIVPIPGYSQDFNNLLIEDLLQKDCSKRISWTELLGHRLWQGKGKWKSGAEDMPPQPLYERYLASKQLQQRTQMCSFGISHVPTVDLVRISQNIHKNLLRESREYSQIELETADVKLNDKDQILDFGEHLIDEEDIENNNEKDLLDNDYIEEVKSERIEEKSDRNIKIEKIEKIEKNSKAEKKSKIGRINKVEKIEIKPEKKLTITENPESVEKKAQNDNFRPMTIQAKTREISVEDKSHQRSNSAQATPTSRSLLKAPAISELIIHSSDNAVKPIVGNKEIDKPLELAYSTQSFNFLIWSQEEILSKGDSPQLEEHFHLIFSALNSTAVDKQHLLAYFESLILNSIVANKLINSAFVNIFIKILKTNKNPLIKARVCSILGQLLRHSTLINVELSQSGLFQALSDLIKDKSEKLSRKAMAALGEYLFYAATQMDDLQTEWEIPNTVFALVIRTSKLAEDEALRFYACKTIENICAQSSKAGVKFSVAEVLLNYIGIYLSSKHDSFKASAAVAISHIVRLNLSLVSLFCEKFPVKVLVSAVVEEQPRIQQAFLTTILYIFISESRFIANLTEDRQFLANILSLFESSTIVIRGKSILVSYYIIKSNRGSLLKLSELKFFAILEKLVRDSYKYVQNCMCHLLDLLGEVAFQCLKTLYEDLRKNSRSSSLQIIVLILTSGACNLKLPYQQCLKAISDCFSISGNNIDSLQQTLGVLEALVVHIKCLFPHSDYILSTILPSLLNTRQCSDTDVRFRCLKIFSDILIPFLYEESIYEPAEPNRPSTKTVNDLITRLLLPLFYDLLQDTDPIPLYALKLLSAVLERHMPFTVAIKKLRLIPVIIDNFQGGHPKLNLHLISVVKKIIESQELSLDELGELGLIEKVSSVMRVIQEQDWCVEKMLDILYELLSLTADTLRAKRSDHSVLRITEPLCENFVSCTKILGFMNEPVRIM